MLAGLETSESESAKIEFSKQATIGFLPQEPKLNASHSILEEIFSSDYPPLKAISDYNKALLENNADATLIASTKIDELDAWQLEAKVKEILFKFNLTDLTKKIGVLSGGEQKRIAFTKILITQPDLMILDEPTNHLDVHMIEWLEDYFNNENKTLFVVTHDRYFMEHVCKKIIELDHGDLFSYSGGYLDFVQKKEERLNNMQVVHQKLKQRYKKELDWVRRQPKARGTKSKDRTDRFYTIKTAVKNYKTENTLSINIKETRLGSKIIELINLHKAYDNKLILKGFDYKFKRFDRLGIVGVNGAGKSTLLKIITQTILPDKGKVIHGETIKIGYYKQTGLQVDGSKRVIEYIRDIAEYIPLEKGQKLWAEQLLENFLFSREQQQQRISTLSGGERKRLYLLGILMDNPNFLILDEPTNDLDIVTLGILENYLSSFKGCLIIVSHDRYFMDRLVDHLFVLEGDGIIKDFPGNYSDYTTSKTNPPKKSAEQPLSPQKKSNTQNFEKHKKIRSLEKSLKKLETQKKEVETQMLDPTLPTGELMQKSEELDKIKAQIEEKEMLWLELSEE